MDEHWVAAGTSRARQQARKSVSDTPIPDSDERARHYPWASLFARTEGLSGNGSSHLTDMMRTDLMKSKRGFSRPLTQDLSKPSAYAPQHCGIYH